MEDEILYITEEFSDELANLGCGRNDFITITRREGVKVFFTAGPCKFNIQASEVQNVTLNGQN
jgi:hypothetical protein